MSTKTVRVMILTCSTRPGAIGPAVAEWVLRTLRPLASSLGAELQHVSLSDLGLPFLDEEDHPSSGIYRNQHTREWSELVDAADGFITITPEYNHGMPATLKNALDYLGSEWAWKPMGFVGYGNTSAGTRAVQHATQVTSSLRLVATGTSLALRLPDVVDDGDIRDDPRRAAMAHRMLEELVRLAHALAPVREAAASTARPGPVPGSYARALGPDDAAHVLVLQRCCWVDEARANATLDLAALNETLDDVRAWLAEWSTTGVWLDGRLIGAVRVRTDSGTGEVGRLAVVPDLRGHGIGRWLLREATEALRGSSDRVRLHTGSQSAKNIALYSSEGFAHEGASAPGTVALLKRF